MGKDCGIFHDLLQQAQSMEDTRSIGCELNARANLLNLGDTLENGHVMTCLGQGHTRREPTDASTDDNNGQWSHCLTTFIRPVVSKSLHDFELLDEILYSTTKDKGLKDNKWGHGEPTEIHKQADLTFSE
jgi:hypothetical protein